VGKPEGKTSLEIHGRRWEDNIETDFTETAWDGLDWIGLAQDGDVWQSIVNKVMKSWFP